VKKLSLPILFSLISLYLTGCAEVATNEKLEPLNETINTGAYIAEPLLVPHKLIYCDAVFDEVLYYVGSEGEPNNELILLR